MTHPVGDDAFEPRLILVVDDEPDMRHMLRRVLERAGYRVHEAGDGAATVRAVAAAQPDLVITDVMMPVMGGVELIRVLRHDDATSSIPILAVSGDIHLALGADSVLAKP